MEDQIYKSLLESINTILTAYGITEDTPVNSLTKNTVKNLTRSIAGVLETAIKYSKEV